MAKILAIDDINDNLISIKAIINDAFPGSEVLTALSGSEGIELAITSKPDVILLDIVMPGMDGFEVCRRLKKQELIRAIPVVFLTALKSDKVSRIKALEVGAEGFLSKPIDEPELIAQIRAMIKINTANELKRSENDRLNKLVEERTRELVKSEAMLKGIFENLQDAYFQADNSGKFIVVSPSAVRMYGYKSSEELIGQSSDSLYYNQHKRESMLARLRTHGRIEDYVCQGMKKGGSAFWVSINVQQIYGNDGEVIGTEGVVRDITERKLVEERLRDSNDLNSSLLQTIPFAIDIVDENGNILFQSENLKKLFGSVVIGHKCWEFYRDNQRQCEECPLLSGIKLGKTEMYESHGVLGGRIFEISHTGMLFKGKKAMLEIFMDITDRKKNEELIRKNSMTLELAMQTANMAWWELDVATGLVSFEKRKAEMLGYAPEKFKHYQDFMDLVHPDDYDLTKKAMKSHLSGAAPKYEIEYRIKAKSGDYIWYLDIGTVIHRDSTGLPITVAGLALNISDRKNAELELLNAKFKAEESDRLKSAFLANMSHEIRTPLNSIIGFSELMTDPDFNIEQQLSFARLINTSGNNLLTIITDIMDISKIEAGQVTVHKKGFSINNLLKNIITEYRFKASEKSIEMRLNQPDHDSNIVLNSDETKIRQILTNLVGNAIKFTHNGYIEIGLKPSGDFFQLHVKDTGIGIPKEFHNNIFERFRQVEAAETRKVGGNGLGLAISKSLVEILGGNIWVESEQGKGSTFYFTIPK